MAKSLADLRAAKPKSRPERVYTVCLAQHLVAEVGSLTDELASLEAAASGENPGPKRLAGDPRVDEIKERLSALLEEMGEHEGELRLRALPDGEWRRWTNEHPARAEGEPGAKRDGAVSFGFCNADDLIDALGLFAISWNSEPLEDGDWDILTESISAADKKHLAATVVQMHESDISIPKWRQLLSANLRNESGGSSPEASESPTSDSTAGSPPSDTSTSTQTGD